MKSKLDELETGPDKYKTPTIEELENDFWVNDDHYPSHLVKTIHGLRKKPLEDFTAEDLRIMIGQNLSSPIVLPLAIDVLADNILAEGDYCPGDLLEKVIQVNPEFWLAHPDMKRDFINLLNENREHLDSSEIVSVREFL